MMIIAVGSGEQIARLVPELAGCSAAHCSRLNACACAGMTATCCRRPVRFPPPTSRDCRVAEADGVCLRANAPWP